MNDYLSILAAIAAAYLALETLVKHGGRAVRQTSCLLIHGTILKWLRDFKWRSLVNKTRLGKWFFAKWDELFDCPLCMNTQVALWLVGVPVAAFDHFVLRALASLRPDIPLLLDLASSAFIGYFAWQAVACEAMVVWNTMSAAFMRKEITKLRWKRMQRAEQPEKQPSADGKRDGAAAPVG
ncbi:MAG: hypothetical protein HY519_02530 [Candidatus Aenigmarchaeota archaeon]|nr:hypothetical protein [Candidatus Aenigmarchaeota archaeon]